MKKIIFFLCILNFSSFLCAKSLKEILNLVENSEQLKAKSYIVDSTLKKSEGIKLKYLPSLNLELNYYSFDKDRYLILPKNTMNASLVLDVLLYDGQRSSNIKLAEKNYELNKVELEKNKNELELELTKLYYTYLTLDDNIKFKKQNIDYLTAALNRLSKLVSVGLKNNDELQIFKARVELEKNDLKQSQFQQEEIKSIIYVITNENYIPTKGSLISYNDNLTNSYEVQINKIKQEMSSLNKDVAFSNFLPKIFVKNIFTKSRLNYDYEIFAPLDVLVKSKAKENMISNTFIFGFSWNIFSFGADKKFFESAKLEELAAKNLENQSIRKNKENIRLIKEKLTIIEEEIKANENILKASDIAFNSIEKKYTAGLLSYVEYLDALGKLYGANANLSLSKSKYEIEKAKLLLEQGILISNAVVEF
ncbi:TolC family protein [Campylobacter sp. MG1]|uniref:TolC family protein n=1 Tax=Campylobacter sp. MG1 TaxID=2976332 RepID=UPI00226C71B7|nr:TolC family protein [Campylobacter sp. MG1]